MTAPSTTALTWYASLWCSALAHVLKADLRSSRKPSRSCVVCPRTRPNTRSSTNKSSLSFTTPSHTRQLRTLVPTTPQTPLRLRPHRAPRPPLAPGSPSRRDRPMGVGTTQICPTWARRALRMRGPYRAPTRFPRTSFLAQKMSSTRSSKRVTYVHLSCF